jgi:gamma-glutamyl-gamma-aminobutyrate hydrolase PuuD
MIKRLGLTMRVTQELNYHEPRDAVAWDWYPFLKEAMPETTVVLMPNAQAQTVEMVRQLKLEGLLFTGGNDVGESPKRDQTEKMLLDYAILNQLPCLGVCRGLQFMAHYFGADLSSCATERHRAKRHKIIFSGHAGLSLKAEEPVEVNSYHNQQVILPDDSQFKVFAMSEDNAIEGIRHKKHPLIAVMWHPERETQPHPWDIELFRTHFKKKALI